MAHSDLCVVDTNVAIAANGNSSQASPETVLSCIDTLLSITKRGGLVLDIEDRIFSEYSNKLSFAGQPGTGDMFLKWVHDHRWDERWCELRSLTCHDESNQVFAEFPSHEALIEFDPSDRKFVAVANAGAIKPHILQALDFKWIGWKAALAEVGISVRFINEEEAQLGYQSHVSS